MPTKAVVPKTFLAPSSRPGVRPATMLARRPVTSGVQSVPTSGPHRFLESQADVVITAEIQLAEFNDRGINTSTQLHEQEWLFVLRRSKGESDRYNVVLSAAQVNVLLEMMYATARAEFTLMRSDILQVAAQRNMTLPSDIDNMSEAELERLVGLFDDPSGIPSPLAFLTKRFIVDALNFIGVQWTNTMPQAPEGAGITVVMGGKAKANAMCIAPTKQGDHLFWILKRRITRSGNYGAFAITLQPYPHAKGPSLQELSYPDLGRYTQYGAVMPVGYICEKEYEDPTTDAALTAHGLKGSIDQITSATLSLNYMQVALTNYSVRGAVWTFF